MNGRKARALRMIANKQAFSPKIEYQKEVVFSGRFSNYRVYKSPRLLVGHCQRAVYQRLKNRVNR